MLALVEVMLFLVWPYDRMRSCTRAILGQPSLHQPILTQLTLSAHSANMSERVYLDLRGQRFDLDKTDLMNLPESVLL